MHQELEKLYNKLGAELPSFRIDGQISEEGFNRYRDILRDMRVDGERFDAGETAFLARELLFVKAQEITRYYEALRASLFIPLSNEVESVASSFSVTIWTQVGSAKVVENYGTDFPRSDAYIEEVSWPIKSLGNSYGVSVMDLRRSARYKKDIPSRRAATARQAHETLADTILSLGHTVYGLGGFIKNANVPVATAGTTPGFTGGWTTAKATDAGRATILADLRWLELQVTTQSKDNHKPDTILFDSTSWSTLTTTPAHSYNPQVTLLQAFLNSSQYVKNADKWSKLDLADTQGDGARGVVYSRNKEYLAGEIPQPFEQFAPQQQNLELVTPCHSRIAGTAWYQPLSGLYFENHNT